MLPVQRHRMQSLRGGPRSARAGVCTDDPSPGTVALMIPIPQRVLIGPGPSDVPPRVLEAIAHPTIGHLDQLTHVDENRVELTFPREIRAHVVAALRAAHPYEEPAFHVLENQA